MVSEGGSWAEKESGSSPASCKRGGESKKFCSFDDEPMES